MRWIRGIVQAGILALTVIGAAHRAQAEIFVGLEYSLSPPTAMFAINPPDGYPPYYAVAENTNVETLEGATIGPDGLLYVTGNSLGAGSVYRISPGDPLIQTQNVFIPFSFDSPFTVPSTPVFGPDGNLYVGSIVFKGGSFGPGQVLEFNGSTGAYMGAFVAPGSGGLTSPNSLVFRDGSLFVSSRSQGVLRYDAATGAFQGTFVAPGSGGLNSAAFFTFSPFNGDLYVSDPTGNDILLYNGTTGAFIDTFVAPGSGGLSSPQGLAFDNDGNLSVASANTDNVLEYSGSTGAYLGIALNTHGSPPSFLYSTAVPEPGTLSMLAVGLIAILVIERRLGIRHPSDPMGFDASS